jgi:hypothetical protein
MPVPNPVTCRTALYDATPCQLHPNTEWNKSRQKQDTAPHLAHSRPSVEQPATPGQVLQGCASNPPLDGPAMHARPHASDMRNSTSEVPCQTTPADKQIPSSREQRAATHLARSRPPAAQPANPGQLLQGCASRPPMLAVQPSPRASCMMNSITWCNTLPAANQRRTVDALNKHNRH